MNEDRLAEQIGRAQRASELLNDGPLLGPSRPSQSPIERWEFSNDPNERERDLVQLTCSKKLSERCMRRSIAVA